MDIEEPFFLRRREQGASDIHLVTWRTTRDESRHRINST